VATLSVFSQGERIGTVYLAAAAEANRTTLSKNLTALLTEVSRSQKATCRNVATTGLWSLNFDHSSPDKAILDSSLDRQDDGTNRSSQWYGVVGSRDHRKVCARSWLGFASCHQLTSPNSSRSRF